MTAGTATDVPHGRAFPDRELKSAATPEPVEATRLDGFLELVCVADSAGRGYLARQLFRVPFHISKPYWNDQALVVQLVNPTAGQFAGDTLRCRVRVESGARLHLTAPSASRIHTTRGSGAALDQKFFAARGGWLEFQPALPIPQRRCRFRQKTDIEVETGGELFFIETFAPGPARAGRSPQKAAACLRYFFTVRRSRFVRRATASKVPCRRCNSAQ